VQVPNSRYKPPTVISDNAATSAGAFTTHARYVTSRYGAVTAINLSNQHGTEGRLCEQFARCADGVRASVPFTLVPFDFHAECGKTSYECARLCSVLIFLFAFVGVDFGSCIDGRSVMQVQSGSHRNAGCKRCCYAACMLALATSSTVMRSQQREPRAPWLQEPRQAVETGCARVRGGGPVPDERRARARERAAAGRDAHELHRLPRSHQRRAGAHLWHFIGLRDWCLQEASLHLGSPAGHLQRGNVRAVGKT
jgi:SacI homology domain